MSDKSNAGNFMKAITVDLKDLVVLKSENAEFLEEASQVLLDYFLKKNSSATDSNLIAFERKKMSNKKEKIHYDLEFLFKFQHLQYKLDTNVQNLAKLLGIRRDDYLLIEENNLNDADKHFKNEGLKNGRRINSTFKKNGISNSFNDNTNGIQSKNNGFKVNHCKNDEIKDVQSKNDEFKRNQSRNEDAQSRNEDAQSRNEDAQSKNDEFKRNQSRNEGIQDGDSKIDKFKDSSFKTNDFKGDCSKDNVLKNGHKNDCNNDTHKVYNRGINPFRISFDVRDL